MKASKPINYAEEYHGMKPSLFRESENLDRLLQAIFDVCDDQQRDFLWLAENLLNLDLAEKSHLDFIGNIVGQPRFLSDFNTEPYFGFDGSYQSKTFGSALDPEVGGYWNSRSYFNTATSRQLNDDEYRRLIKARAIYNQSNCSGNDLLEVVNLITNSKNNTVQLMRHGLIQINTDDTTGILSYFVDRLYNEDNILPIAAGVRVGLEEAQSITGGEGGGGGESEELDLYEIFYKINGQDVPLGDTDHLSSILKQAHLDGEYGEIPVRDYVSGDSYYGINVSIFERGKAFIGVASVYDDFKYGRPKDLIAAKEDYSLAISELLSKRFNNVSEGVYKIKENIDGANIGDEFLVIPMEGITQHVLVSSDRDYIGNSQSYTYFDIWIKKIRIEYGLSIDSAKKPI